MYLKYIRGQIHQLFNESKKWFFAYNSGRRMYESQSQTQTADSTISIA